MEPPRPFGPPLLTQEGSLDPFQFYYGYYLPHAAAIAAQPTPLDTINQVTAARQFSALSERQGLYDPISPYGEEDLDPNRPYSAKYPMSLHRSWEPGDASTPR